MVERTIKSQTFSLNPNQILTKELCLDMKQWEELIRENVFGLGGHQDRLPACLAHMLYCVVTEEQYNLAYFFVNRIECAKATPTANLLYGMFLTRLYRYVMEMYPHLDNGTYDIVERVMRTSSHQHGDDDDVETSRASTPSPTTYHNSLNLLDYQTTKCHPLSNKPMNLSLHDKPPCLTKRNECMRKYAEGSSYLERH
nr:ribosomal protein L7Ae/L30e/S12e/Gadd45 [Tanacetum cinerariifolium]